MKSVSPPTAPSFYTRTYGTLLSGGESQNVSEFQLTFSGANCVFMKHNSIGCNPRLLLVRSIDLGLWSHGGISNYAQVRQRASGNKPLASFTLLMFPDSTCGPWSGRICSFARSLAQRAPCPACLFEGRKPLSGLSPWEGTKYES